MKIRSLQWLQEQTSAAAKLAVVGVCSNDHHRATIELQEQTPATAKSNSCNG